MKHNLYSLTEDELNRLCVESLFDRKDTYILKAIILHEWTIETISYDLGLSSNAICKRIKKIKQKLNIVKWTDNLVG